MQNQNTENMSDDLLVAPIDYGTMNEQDARDSGYIGKDGKAVSKARPDREGSPTGAYTDIGAGRSSVVVHHDGRRNLSRDLNQHQSAKTPLDTSQRSIPWMPIFLILGAGFLLYRSWPRKPQQDLGLSKVGSALPYPEDVDMEPIY